MASIIGVLVTLILLLVAVIFFILCRNCIRKKRQTFSATPPFSEIKGAATTSYVPYSSSLPTTSPPYSSSLPTTTDSSSHSYTDSSTEYAAPLLPSSSLHPAIASPLLQHPAVDWSTFFPPPPHTPPVSLRYILILLHHISPPSTLSPQPP